MYNIQEYDIPTQISGNCVPGSNTLQFLKELEQVEILDS